jgi:hypothetical protein
MHGLCKISQIKFNNKKIRQSLKIKHRIIFLKPIYAIFHNSEYCSKYNIPICFFSISIFNTFFL